MPSVSMPCLSRPLSASTAASANASASGPSITTATPGLVQNCPTPIVSDAAQPFPISAPLAFTAAGIRNIGLIEPTSP